MLEVSVIVAVLAIAALSRAHQPVGDEPAGRWAEAHGLELTPENRPLVVGYLRHARLLRTWGAVAGLLAPTVVRLALGEPVHVAGIGTYDKSPGELGLVFVGYLVGAVGAELSVVRPLHSARRSAALLPRELGDYLPRRLVWTQRGLAAVFVLGLVALPLLPYGTSTAVPSWPSVLAFAAVIGGFAAALERLERWIVRRPQPFVSEPLLAADDAIRAQSVHSLAGAGVAFLLFGCSLVAFALTWSDVTVLRRTMWVPAVVLLLLALTACQYYGDRAWRVRRDVRGRARAASA